MRVSALSCGNAHTRLFFATIKFLPVDAGVLPTSASARQVDDVLRTQFAPGRTSTDTSEQHDSSHGDCYQGCRGSPREKAVGPVLDIT